MEAILNVLIVDDEPLARQSVRAALEPLDGIRVAGEAADGAAAAERISSGGVDAVFLDIRMRGLDGIGLARTLKALPAGDRPEIVFVTAHDEHAVHAFELEAADYVLKPVDPDRIREAVDRLVRRRRLRSALLAMEGGGPGEGPVARAPDAEPASRIMVRDGEAIRFVPVERVVLFEAEGNYVRLHTDDGDTHLARLTLKSVTERLDPRAFVRVHRSHVVSVDRIREVRPWFGGDYVACLDDGREVRVSRTYRDNLLRAFL